MISMVRDSCANQTTRLSASRKARMNHSSTAVDTCLPMGVAQVSSVVITAEVGKTLHKGEELGYFQFGGSDFVMVFERSSNVQLISQPNVHYNQGTWIGSAYP